MPAAVQFVLSGKAPAYKLHNPLRRAGLTWIAAKIPLAIIGASGILFIVEILSGFRKNVGEKQ